MPLRVTTLECSGKHTDVDASYMQIQTEDRVELEVTEKQIVIRHGLKIIKTISLNPQDLEQ